MKGAIALEDGKVFYGESFGAEGERSGEIVFNTSITGYQEILTDPSYCGQIVILTYPHIGNYGINFEDFESSGPKVEGFIVREASGIFSNWRGEFSLQEFLQKNNIVALEGVDTRALTKHIREKGAMRSIISTTDLDKESLVRKAKLSPSIIKRDLVKFVTCEKKHTIEPKKELHKIGILDCGVKSNILNSLLKRNCKLTIFPANTPPDEIINEDIQGLLLSNGPGDPEGVEYVIETVREIIKMLKDGLELPIFGICLGHQIIALASGGKTFKLKFGHRGANHPVKEIKTQKIEITSQNHGFCVDPDTVCEEFEITHFNLYDNTLEGLRHKELPIFSVQYHPEASPGPHESNYLFDNFIRMIEDYA